MSQTAATVYSWDSSELEQHRVPETRWATAQEYLIGRGRGESRRARATASGSTTLAPAVDVTATTLPRGTTGYAGERAPATNGRPATRRGVHMSAEPSTAFDLP